jgi:nucleoid DNA-binding protein
LNQPNQLIWDYVKDLLHSHDCVIVPGFGGFVCNKEAARIDQVSHVITPPSRKVVFNQNLKTNDGLLAGFWSQKQQVAYSQAVSIIEECVQTTLDVLQDKKLLSIDLFGSFRLNAEANYVFLPDKRNNYLTSSYGLTALPAQPVTARKARVAKPRVFTSPKSPTMKSKRNFLPATLITLMVLILGVNGFIFFNDSNLAPVKWGENTQTMSITSWFDSLFNSHSKPQEQPQIAIAETTNVDSSYIPPAPAIAESEPTQATVDTIQPAVASTNIEPATPATTELDIYAPYYAFATHYQAARASLYVPQQPSDVVETVPAEVPTTPTETITEPAEAITTTKVDVKTAVGYYVIGGVFCKERNAKRFLKQLNDKGFSDAELLVNTKINCKRVSYKKFASKHQAESFCVQMQNESNPSAWILEIQ